MTISEYIKNINTRYKTGISREHAYRGDLQNLLEGMLKNVLVTNEPARIECGAPDFILTRKDIPVGYMEAKDIGEPLTGSKHKEQFNRYKESLPKLIFTDYLDFHFYRDGEFVTSVRIAELAGDTIRAVPEAEDKFQQMINDFATLDQQTITTASKLSTMMAGKARLLSTIVENALKADEGLSNRVNEPDNITLRGQLTAFRNVLIHDIDVKEFADIYAQTIAYGMFAARLHDKELETFSRQGTAQMIPKSNPFLRNLFHYIAGFDLDKRIDWVVDALADIFRATDVNALLTNFGKATQQTDPIIHFYETFLKEFDNTQRVKYGVWYTPEPVVNFIVRAVDDILKDEFGLKDGLADTSKTKMKVKMPTHDGRFKDKEVEEEREVHKVQILDPAAGTGTFLAEVIKQIHSKFEGQQGIWPDYVDNHLIPRLNGFEILMASYAMAHLKLDLLLKETGYNRESQKRFKVYLTDSLEEHFDVQFNLFAQWLSNEANEANHIKRDTPVMVVLGNPPYSGESQNKGEWIMELMEDYKKEPGGKEKLKERNPKWINDDYVKFLRFGQHFIEKNGEGVLAFINPHGFLDNPTFRGMRWNLLKTYDKIYTIDLHGNTKKKEVSPDGSPDENVFDIQQGVSINLMIKTGLKKQNELGEIFHFDLYGSRFAKYKWLFTNSLKDISFEALENVCPKYYFTSKDFKKQREYLEGFCTNSLFILNSSGMVTARDNFTISFDKEDIKTRIEQFLTLNDEEARVKFQLGKDVRDWKVHLAKEDLKRSGPNFKKIVPISYRVFDDRFTYFTGNSKGFHCMPRGEVMQHFIGDNSENLGFVTVSRQPANNPTSYYFVAKNIISNGFIRSDSVSIDNLSPLYIYPKKVDQQSLDGTLQRKPNLNPKIVKQIADGLGLTFTPEPSYVETSEGKKERAEGAFAPIDLLDYIYAVLHSPTYRETYKEFLKIDFPRVPYPGAPETFWKLVELGGELRQIHLLENPVVNDFITTYPKAGSNKITNRLTKNDPGFVPDEETVSEKEISPGGESREAGGVSGTGTRSKDSPATDSTIGKVWINDEQYFGNVPLKAWEFYIGGYQPAEKWLKDRRDRTLSMEEIQHYQKIIVALVETGRIMGEIDGIFKIDNE